MERRRRHGREFKLEAVRLVRERGVPIGNPLGSSAHLVGQLSPDPKASIEPVWLSLNPVSDEPARILKITEQRLGREVRQTQCRIPEIVPQRLRTTVLTVGSVACFLTARGFNPETGLAGWGNRIRTLESGDASPAGGT